MTDIDYAAQLVAAIRDIPPDRRLDAIAIACRLFIEGRIPEKGCVHCGASGNGIHVDCGVYGTTAQAVAAAESKEQAK
jgi:hypothetical protein